MTKKTEKAILRLRKAGKSIKSIAKEVGASDRTVSAFLKSQETTTPAVTKTEPVKPAKGKAKDKKPAAKQKKQVQGEDTARIPLPKVRVKTEKSAEDGKDIREKQVKISIEVLLPPEVFDDTCGLVQAAIKTVTDVLGGFIDDVLSENDGLKLVRCDGPKVSRKTECDCTDDCADCDHEDECDDCPYDCDEDDAEEDESDGDEADELSRHDAKFHNGNFDPKKDVCAFRKRQPWA